MRVLVPEIVGTALSRDGYIEAPLTEVLLERLRPGMVFVDVGAHYGYHTLVASRLVGPDGRVFAFEPARRAFELLQRNVVGLGNVEVVNAAVHSSCGAGDLHDFGPGHSALSTLFATARVPDEERRTLTATTYPVRCTTLDDHLGAAGVVPDVVKLDAEGSERAILEGMRGLLRHGRPLIALETGDYDGMASPETAASIDFLESFGYRPFEYAGGGALRPHRRQARYGYDNLFFVKEP